MWFIYFCKAFYYCSNYILPGLCTNIGPYSQAAILGIAHLFYYALIRYLQNKLNKILIENL
jgi:hypothetical protein